MTNIEFKDNIYTALQSYISLEVLVKILWSFKESGGEQTEAYSILEEIREEITEEPLEDRLLEVMDFASGFCPIDKRIWQ
ncbi:MAG: hypothetical protein ACE1ZS_10375 [Candidatus Poribacteria bacterium]